MPELIIESVPSGAEVQIDGEIVGTTPLTIPIEERSLEEFRTECLTDGAVSCSFDVLKARLEDQTISRLWWDLTEPERRSIAEMAIKNILFYEIDWKRKGLPNCEGGTGDWTDAACAADAMIRYVLFGHYMNNMDTCYYRRSIDSDELCFAPRYSYNLPCHMVSCRGINDHKFGHTMCSIQVSSEVNKLSSWIVFQDNNFDIQPGGPHIPTGTKVIIYVPDRFTPCGGSGIGHIVATFILDRLKEFRIECLTDGSISCGWDTLKTRLEDQTVSQLWWDLTEAERRSIAEWLLRTHCFMC